MITLPGIRRDTAHTSGDVARALLWGGLVPLLLGAVVLTVVAGLRDGPPALVAAAVGSVLAAGAFAVGPGLLVWSAKSAPHLVLVAALMGYTTTIVLLGTAFLVLRRVDWLAHGYLAAALVLSTLLWLVGEAWTASRLRLPVFSGADDDAPVARGDDDG